MHVCKAINDFKTYFWLSCVISLYIESISHLKNSFPLLVKITFDCAPEKANFGTFNKIYYFLNVLKYSIYVSYQVMKYLVR